MATIFKEEDIIRGLQHGDGSGVTPQSCVIGLYPRVTVDRPHPR